MFRSKWLWIWTSIKLPSFCKGCPSIAEEVHDQICSLAVHSVFASISIFLSLSWETILLHLPSNLDVFSTFAWEKTDVSVAKIKTFSRDRVIIRVLFEMPEATYSKVLLVFFTSDVTHEYLYNHLRTNNPCSRKRGKAQVLAGYPAITWLVAKFINGIATGSSRHTWMGSS